MRSALELHREYSERFKGCIGLTGEKKAYCVENKLPELTEMPILAVAIAALNEGLLLPRLLASLKQAIKLAKLSTEVIIVDNGSTDETPEIVGLFGAKLIHESVRSIPAARSTALSNINNSVRLVLSVDSDGVVPSKWIKKYWDHFQRDSSLVFGYGGVIPKFDFLPPINQLVPGAVMSFGNFAVRFVRVIRNVPMKPNSCNLAFNRKFALQAGGYNREIQAGEEWDLMSKMRPFGDICYLPNMDVLASNRRKIGMGLLTWIKFACSKEFGDPEKVKPDGVYAINYR